MTRIGSICSGAGMLDEGVRAVLGGEVAWHCEHEPPTEKQPRPRQAAARVLAYRYPGVPNHGDITTVDWARVEPVDVLTGGTPCQDVSLAGRRAGMHGDTRSNLWAAMREAVAQIRPSLVVWENVRGVTSACAHSALGSCPRCVGDDPTAGHAPRLRALGRVVGDLADLGYVGRVRGLAASDVGAPHGRFRIFVAAWPATDTAAGEPPLTDRADAAALVGAGLGTGARAGARRDAPRTAADADDDTTRDGRACGHPSGRRPEPAQRCASAADAHGSRPEGDRTVAARPSLTDAHGDRRAASDTDRDALRHEPVTEPRSSRPAVAANAVQWGAYEPAIRRWERVLGRPAPAPAEPGPKGGQRLSPRFTEWMMGWPAGWVTDVPGITRNDALKITGNGVVPQQAAAALRAMLAAEAAVAA